MSKNSSNSGCSCCSIIIFIILICLFVSFCTRQDKSKGFIDNTIDATHRWTNYVIKKWNYADSVWTDSLEVKRDTVIIYQTDTIPIEHSNLIEKDTNDI